MKRLAPWHRRLVAILVVGVVGCSSKPPTNVEDPGATNLRKVRDAYEQFTESKHRAPRNDEELKPYIQETGVAGDPDQLLRSPRDGQPYVIHYGTKLDSDGRGVILAHEKDGVGGQRFVLTQARAIRLMSDEDFAAATFPAVPQPK